MKQILCIFILTVLFSCKKDSDGPSSHTSHYYFVETLCANPWCHPYSEGCESILGISKYLREELNVSYTGLLITEENNLILCLACSCKTGRIISFLSNDSNEEKLLKAGFIKN
jgi:hypothetical protein